MVSNLRKNFFVYCLALNTYSELLSIGVIEVWGTRSDRSLTKIQTFTAKKMCEEATNMNFMFQFEFCGHDERENSNMKSI